MPSIEKARRSISAPCADRDVRAAKEFFRKALATQGLVPVSITLDGYAASHRAVGEFSAQNPRRKDTRLRSSKYLNNQAEQDHRSVKSRIKPMLGFKLFDQAAVTIAGVELPHRIRKGQFNLGRLRLRGQTAPAIWKSVLSARPAQRIRKVIRLSEKFAPEPFRLLSV